MGRNLFYRRISRFWRFSFLFACITILLLLAGSSSAQQEGADALPDLVITEIWNQGAAVCYQIRNVGSAETKDAGTTGLRVDNVTQATQAVGAGLLPGQRLNRCFVNYAWTCTPLEDAIYVCADINQSVAEANEGNNCRLETWKCDQTAPQITSGPGVTGITTSSATISWKTDEQTDGWVEYDDQEGVFGQQAGHQQPTISHTVVLSSLLPDTAYQFRVRSTDPSGNSVASKAFYFTTLPPSDTSPPVLGSLQTTRQPGKIVYYKMKAPVTEDKGIERVEFYLDNMLLGMDYSPDDQKTPEYEMDLYPAFYNLTYNQFFMPHVVRVRAINAANLAAFQDFPFNPAPDPLDGVLEILSPHPDEIIYIDSFSVPAGTHITFSAHAAKYEEHCTFGPIHGPFEYWTECHQEEKAVDQVEFFLNTTLKSTSLPDNEDDLYHTYDWPAGGSHQGTYELAVKATADGAVAWQTIEFQILRGETDLEVTRTVTRSGPAFTIQLDIHNDGTLAADLAYLYDNLKGFQPLEKTTSNYSIEGQYDPYLLETEAYIDLYTTSSIYYSMPPGGTLTIQYQAVPSLYPDQDMDWYEIGDDALLLTRNTGTGFTEIEFNLPAHETGSGESLGTAVWQARQNADYLIVTNPERLIVENADNDEVYRLLSSLAELTIVKGGMLAYLIGNPSADSVDETIELWGDQMKGRDGVADHFLSDAYLLLVGETEIIPTHSRDIEAPWYASWLDTVTIDYTDLYYADTASNSIDPELSVGRIVGDSAAELQIPVETIIKVYDGTVGYNFDWSSGLAVSGWPAARNGTSTWIDFPAERRSVRSYLTGNGVIVDELNTPDYATRDAAVAAFFSLAPGTDIIHLVGHGNTDVMDDIQAGDFSRFPDPFGTANPFVYGSSCLTGDYTAGFGLAEAFLQNGAGLYLGSTEVSYDPTNRETAENIYSRWDPGEPIGPNVRGEKRDMGAFHAGNWYSGYLEDIWTAEYHLFGDPEYGGDLGLSTPSAVELLSPSGEQPQAITMTLPAYTLEKTYQGKDLASIPGGSHLMMPGLPMVPIYQVVQTYAPGIDIQSVDILSRSGLQTAGGIDLATFEPVAASSAGQQVAEAIQATVEWFPEATLDWHQMEKPDGTTDLVITLYPFYYNSQSWEVQYYTNYSLLISAVVDNTEIRMLRTGQHAYPVGALVDVTMVIEVAGTTADTVAGVAIYRSGSDELVDGLAMETLEGLTGVATFSPSWNSAGQAAGDYDLVARLTGNQGTILDEESYPFRLGVASGVAKALTTPSTFNIGSLVDFSFDFQNTGTLVITPTLEIEVQYPGGQVVAYSSKTFGGLSPNGVVHFDYQWNTTGVLPGIYRVVAHARFGGGTTDPLVAYIGSLPRLLLPIVQK